MHVLTSAIAQSSITLRCRVRVGISICAHKYSIAALVDRNRSTWASQGVYETSNVIYQWNTMHVLTSAIAQSSMTLRCRVRVGISICAHKYSIAALVDRNRSTWASQGVYETSNVIYQWNTMHVLTSAIAQSSMTLRCRVRVGISICAHKYSIAAFVDRNRSTWASQGVYETSNVI
jgi:uncharacterized protein (DUF1501 family)